MFRYYELFTRFYWTLKIFSLQAYTWLLLIHIPWSNPLCLINDVFCDLTLCHIMSCARINKLLNSFASSYFPSVQIIHNCSKWKLILSFPCQWTGLRLTFLPCIAGLGFGTALSENVSFYRKWTTLSHLSSFSPYSC